MTAGYWTILYLIVYSILLVTGWRAWLNKYIATSYGLLFFLIVLTLNRIPARTLPLTSDVSMVLHISVVCVGALLISAMFKSKSWHSVRYIVLSIVMFSLTWALMQVLLQHSPWLKSMLHHWCLPIICGVLLVFLSLTVGQACYVIFWGALLGEYVAAWQQKGHYLGEAGTLGWWDVLLNTFAIVVITHFIVYMTVRTFQFMIRAIMK